MRHGHGKTSNSTSDKVRRRVQPKIDQIKEEKNRRRATRGGQANELGVIQGQNGEQGNAIDPLYSKSIGRTAH